jgi:hypothetical protein
MQTALLKGGLVLAAIGFLFWQARGWQTDSATRHINAGKTEVVALVNDEALQQAEASRLLS